MNKGISIALVAGGILLSVWGISASESFSSDMSRLFTGAPTDKAIWLIIGGVILGVVGSFGLVRGGRAG